MTIYTSPCEGTNAATVTTSNTGASPSFAGAQASMTISNTRSMHGSTSLTAATGSQYVWWANTDAKIFARQYVWIPSLPSVELPIMVVRHAGGTAGQVVVNAANKLRATTSGSGAQTTRGVTDSVNVPTSTWLRIELYIEAGTSTTTGAVRGAAYVGDSLTSFWDSTLVTGIDTAGTNAAFTTERMQVPSGWYVDDMGMKTGTDAVWGAWSSNTAPTQVLTANQNVSASATASVTTTPTDDGTIASYLWSYVSAASTGAPSLTASTTATASFTASTAGNLYTLQSLITDDGGLTATDTTEVRVPVSGASTAVPLALNGTNVVGTMTNTGGASSDGAALADASDSTYIESGTVTGTEQSERYRWQPAGNRATGAMPVRLGTDTGTANAYVRLYEGSTLRQSWGPQAITSTATDYTFTLSAPTIAAVSDWGNLYLEVGFTS